MTIKSKSNASCGSSETNQKPKKKEENALSPTYKKKRPSEGGSFPYKKREEVFLCSAPLDSFPADSLLFQMWLTRPSRTLSSAENTAPQAPHVTRGPPRCRSLSSGSCILDSMEGPVQRQASNARPWHFRAALQHIFWYSSCERLL